MKAAFIISTSLLILFALLAIYDGFYLHILKYRLHEHKDSKSEHLIHTVRAVLFPAILYFLFLSNDLISFYLGMALVILDVIVLGLDAYWETDSRKFMEGLPKWEYILHLFVNGFHFASIAVFLAIKIKAEEHGFQIMTDFSIIPMYKIFQCTVINLLPGGILMAALHILLVIPITSGYFNAIRSRISCC